MTGSSGPQLSKGLRMIAAYRAERLSQRAPLRGSTQRSDAARNAAQEGGSSEAPTECPVDPPRSAVAEPKLAEIGFGPGMLIRLGQLGVNTTADLARADPDRLRAELGEISRLVDVEAWVRHARQTTGSTG